MLTYSAYLAKLSLDCVASYDTYGMFYGAYYITIAIFIYSNSNQQQQKPQGGVWGGGTGELLT